VKSSICAISRASISAPGRAIQSLALGKKHENGSKGVEYLIGDALNLPLVNDSLDIVAAIPLALYPAGQYRRFMREGLRVAKGPPINSGIAPGWNSGDLHVEIEHIEKSDETDRIFIGAFHFTYRDIYSVQEYGTLDPIVSIFGFIFGKTANEHPKRENQTPSGEIQGLLA
jgi:SAM-dependent methyltransferase